MSRLQQWILCLGLLGLGLGVCTLTANQEDAAHVYRVPDFTAEEMEAISLRKNQLHQEIAAQRRFHKKLTTAVRDLIHRPDLRQRTLDVQAAANADNPRFLVYVRQVEAGSTDREKVARNLIANLQAGVQVKEFPPETSTLVEQLQTEVRSPGFLQWCAEEAAPGRNSQCPRH
jgi:hypothetical protein